VLLPQGANCWYPTTTKEGFTMATPNRDLMSQARQSLRGKWGVAAIGTLVYALIMGGLNVIPVAGPIAWLIVGGPLMLGWILFILSISRGAEVRVGRLFDGFSSFGNALVAMLLVSVFTILWLLLLIVPGIIAALRYSMTFFILADNPTMDGLEAIRRSKAMTMGYKYKLFCLGLRFIGWALLGVLSLGIGFFWIAPYMQTSVAKFYDDIKGGAAAVGAQNVQPPSASLAA
jgi:uncharacterized membrane protein